MNAMKYALLSTLCLLAAERSSTADCPVKVIANNFTADIDECTNLQETLERFSMPSTKEDSVIIYVNSGIHYLMAPINFTVKSLQIIGVGEMVNVICSYETAEGEDVTGGEYMWLFQRLDSVIFENLNFSQCQFPFRILHVQRVTIINSLFRYFTEAVLDIFNCNNITLHGLTVENNQGTGIVPISYRGNTGGIAIAYNGLPSNLQIIPTVSITDSTFRNNSALATSRVISISTTAFSQVFTGRGGALGIFVNESHHNVTITIRNCSISGNTARSFGGGIYTLFNGVSAQHVIVLEKTNISSNAVTLHGGGGMQLSFLSNGILTTPHTAIMKDCWFHNNTAEAGGGIFVFTSFHGSDGNYVRFENCVFSSNQGLGSESDYGAAIVLSLLTIYRQRITVPRHEIINCSFLRNYGLNGIVSVGYAPTIFEGENLFSENQGASLRVIGAIVEVGGELIFENNQVLDSAQLYILSFGQIRFKSGTTVTFSRNKGRFGSSISVESRQDLGTFTDLEFNPRCFILHQNFTLPPSQWSNIEVTFKNNSATLASSIYASMLDKCAWNKGETEIFDSSTFPDWPLWRFIDEQNTGYVETHNRTLAIGTNVVEIKTEIAPIIKAWPGEKIKIKVQGIDQFGHGTTAIVRFQFSANPGVRAQVKFTPQIIVIAPDSDNGRLQDEFVLTYSLSTAVQSELNESLGEVSVQIPFVATSVTSDRFVLNYTDCPAGYVLEMSNSGLLTCQCDNTDEILHCEDDQDSIIIKTSYWAYKGDPESALRFLPCPPGYCGCSQNTSLGNSLCVNVYTNSDPNLQCICERIGDLCGECRDGKGFSALLDRCVTCNRTHSLLIILLIVLIFAVFVGIILFDKPLPSWIYPFLFYFQMAPYLLRNIIENFDAFGQFAYYTSSALGFYFVYDFCLYEKMSPLVSYSLRFLPLFVALMVRPILIAIRTLIRKTGKHMKPLYNYGVIWIAVLLYAPILHTSMSLLQCFHIKGRHSLVWSVSGEIGCFAGSHTLLGYLSIIVLMFCVLMIPISLVLSLKDLSEIHKSLGKFYTALEFNYKEEFKWWISVELIKRLLFLLFFLPFPRSVGPIVILVFSISVHGFLKPYREKIANIIELLVQCSFLFLIVLTSVASTRSSLLTYPPDSMSIEECPNGPEGLPDVAWLLLPFLYLPHIVFLICGVCHLSYFLWKKRRSDKGDVVEVSGEVDEQYRSTVAFTRSEVVIFNDTAQ